MNPTQIRGKKWLQTNYGLKNEDLQYTGGVPTFTTKEGAGFLTKRVVGKANQVAVFYPSELHRLGENPDTTILLVPDSGEIIAMPVRALADNPTSYKGIRLATVEPETNGNSGEILLHLSRRASESSYYRVNHIPMESLLVYRDFTGHLSISTANGRPDFWLALEPQMIT